ncbi:MAG: ATP-binding protein [Candidatus Micrarchaeota archaeon]|nr:ATP-binding protein [Candidatus Micrarchaeota archaeon]
MLLDKIFGLLFGEKRPVGLSIQLGEMNSLMVKAGLRIKGSGPYARSYEGGYRWKKVRGKAFLLPSKEPNPHILVSGMSGFGKSMFFKSVLADIVKAGVSCIVFDGHNEHREVVQGLGGIVHDSRNGGINLLSLDGATVADRTASLTALLSNVYGLGHIQSTKLGQCLKYTYRRFGARGGNDKMLRKEPKVSDLLFEINIFVKNSKTASEAASLVHLYSKISNLNTRAFNTPVLENLKGGINSFSISERMSKEARLIYMVELLERVYSGMKDDPKDGKIRQYIMIDESQVLINESEECSGVITKFIEEGRKYGRGVIIVTHMSSRLNRQIVANASTFMAFYSREPSEASYVAKVMTSNFDAEQSVRSKLATLGDGEAMVISANNRTPKVVSTKVLQGKREARGGLDLVGLQALAEKPILLRDLCREFGIDEWQAATMGRELDTFEFGGERWVMKKSNPGIEHEVLVMKIHSLLQQSGVESYIHDRANGPDIVVYHGSGKIAVEYETGMKAMEDTLGMIKKRDSGYMKTVVVVNANSLEKYRGALTDSKWQVFGPDELDKAVAACKG